MFIMCLSYFFQASNANAQAIGNTTITAASVTQGGQTTYTIRSTTSVTGLAANTMAANVTFTFKRKPVGGQWQNSGISSSKVTTPAGAATVNFDTGDITITVAAPAVGEEWRVDISGGGMVGANAPFNLAPISSFAIKPNP
jgi:hypothetical protein